MTDFSMTIFPYKESGAWMFDDESVGLIKEPFVVGMPEIIEHTLAKTGIKNPENGFVLTFSAIPFPGYQVVLRWTREAEGGNFYRLDGAEMEGWACPALFQYFEQAPKTIYCAASAKSAN